MEAVNKVKTQVEEVKLYWKQPKPGEYVPYREILMLSIGWIAAILASHWSIQFGVGNEFTGMTLGMNNNQLLVMGYVAQLMGYILEPLNAYIIDNLRSVHGKYRVYLKLAVPAMCATIISLWFPFKQAGDVSPYLMIFLLFLVGQIQGYIQGWVNTGMWNIVHVLTPNTQERTKIMAISSILYSLGYTIQGMYFPIMVDLAAGGDKYSLTYFRSAYTPLALVMPLVLITYYGTKERLILPKSRITNMSFGNSLRAVATNKIFWIRSADGWNDFLENAKGDVWNWLVYRARIMKSSTYGVMSTFSGSAQLFAMILSPWAIKKFGKRNIKIWKNIIQVVLIAAMGLVYRSKFAVIALFIIDFINRFVDCGNVIDSSIDSDMRDNQQYISGERIDGAFSVVKKYAGGLIGAATGLFLPWVYKQKGFDGNDYSVLDVYNNYNPDLPNSQQELNPNCVLYPLLNTLILISVIGAAIDVLPWLFYDITETGQRSMIRVIRIRTVVEDRDSDERDEDVYIEGCEALFKAETYSGQAKKEAPRKELLREARALPRNTDDEKQARRETIQQIKDEKEDVRVHNEEIEIADFVMRELTRFQREFGQKQLEIAKLIVSHGPEHFYDCAQEAIQLAHALPKSDCKEEKQWRRQEVRNANALVTSAKKAAKHYPNGVVPYDPQSYDDAYDMPDETRQQAKLRRAAMKKANKERNIYGAVAAPYLAAKRTVELARGYGDIKTLTQEYDDAVARRDARHAEEKAEAQRLADQQKMDLQRRRSQGRLRRK